MATCWTVVPQADGEAAFIELVTVGPTVIEARIKPLTTIHLLRVLQEARDNDHNHGIPPLRAGWRTRKQLKESLVARLGYPLRLETISRYVSDLLGEIKRCAEKQNQPVPPLIERQRALGMRLADGVQIKFC